MAFLESPEPRRGSSSSSWKKELVLFLGDTEMSISIQGKKYLASLELDASQQWTSSGYCGPLFRIIMGSLIPPRLSQAAKVLRYGCILYA